MSPAVSLLVEAPRLTPFDQRRWVLQCPTGHQLLLNPESAALVTLLARAASYDQGCAAFNDHYGATLTAAEFERLVHARFGGYQLLAADPAAPRPAIGHPIRFRLPLLPARWAGSLAAPLTRLYSPRVFWPLLATVTAVLGLVGYWLPPAAALPAAPGLLLLFYGSVLVHELGHIAACRRAGLPHGGIGFGVYLLLPVLYADVTAIWQAPRAQRVIANLGGIFSQLLYAALVAAGGLALHAPAWTLTAEAIALSAAWQLNPFVRHDGYWLLADLTNTPNLLAQARRARQRLLSRAGLRTLRAGAVTSGVGRSWAWLLAYDTANRLVLLAVVAVLLHAAGPAILQTPVLINGLVDKLLAGTLTPQDFSTRTLTAFAFYGFLFQVGLLPYIGKVRGFFRGLVRSAH